METNVNNFMILDNKELVRVMHSGYIPNRKWTYIKYADGRTEWVATTRLKKNFHTRAIEFIMGMGFLWDVSVKLYAFLCIIAIGLLIASISFICFYIINFIQL